jgi:hypothetical protein
MKTSAQKFVSLIILALLLPFAVWSRNQSVAAQSTVTSKWKFNGNDAGTNTYQIHPDGSFESLTDTLNHG